MLSESTFSAQARAIEEKVKGAIAKRSNLNRDYQAEKRNKKILKSAADRVFKFVDREANGIEMLRSGLQVSQPCAET